MGACVDRHRYKYSSYLDFLVILETLESHTCTSLFCIQIMKSPQFLLFIRLSVFVSNFCICIVSEAFAVHFKLLMALMGHF